MDALIGALVGAGVGALASWIFALDLRARDAKHVYLGELNSAVAAVVEGIGLHSAAAQAFSFTSQGLGSAPPPHEARARAITSVRLGQMIAHGEDKLPFDAAFELLTEPEPGTGSKVSIDRENAQMVLVAWRRGEYTPGEAAVRIRMGRPRGRAA